MSKELDNKNRSKLVSINISKLSYANIATTFTAIVTTAHFLWGTGVLWQSRQYILNKTSIIKELNKKMKEEFLALLDIDRTYDDKKYLLIKTEDERLALNIKIDMERIREDQFTVVKNNMEQLESRLAELEGRKPKDLNLEKFRPMGPPIIGKVTMP